MDKEQIVNGAMTPGVSVATVKKELYAMSVPQLKKHIRDEVEEFKSGSTNLCNKGLNFMRKDECIDYILYSHVPADIQDRINEKERPQRRAPTATLNKSLDGFEGMVAGVMEKIGFEQIQEDQIRAIIIDELNNRTPSRMVIDVKEQELILNRVEGRQHYKFPIMLKSINADSVNLCLTGPAGSGKTRCCLEASKAMDLPFYLMPFNKMSTKSDVVGYMDANGRYVDTPFTLAFKNGGLFIADEFDCCHPAVATILNAAIGNRVITLPNGETVYAHANFKPVFIMNTEGTGATSQYVGRSALDGATLDRFACIYFDYDLALEASLVGIKDNSEDGKKQKCIPEEGGIPIPEQWYYRVRSVRDAIAELKLQNIISPRATKAGMALAKTGIGIKHLSDMLLFKGLSKEQRERVKEEANRQYKKYNSIVSEALEMYAKQNKEAEQQAIDEEKARRLDEEHLPIQ